MTFPVDPQQPRPLSPWARDRLAEMRAGNGAAAIRARRMPETTTTNELEAAFAAPSAHSAKLYALGESEER